jgi:hypothetical protein
MVNAAAGGGIIGGGIIGAGSAGAGGREGGVACFGAVGFGRRLGLAGVCAGTVLAGVRGAAVEDSAGAPAGAVGLWVGPGGEVVDPAVVADGAGPEQDATERQMSPAKTSRGCFMAFAVRGRDMCWSEDRVQRAVAAFTAATMAAFVVALVVLIIWPSRGPCGF